jgi:glutamyl-tRNA reductase
LGLIVVLGVNHRTAPLRVREKLAFDEAAASAALQRLRADGRLEESLLLSTCNRTELYAVAEAPQLAAQCLRDVVCRSSDVDPLAEGSHSYVLVEREAIRHALRVASGLDSQLLGEKEILGQVRRAYTRARAAGTAGTTLGRLFETAIRAGKRAHAETAIAHGSVSVAGAALDMVASALGGLSGKRFLVVGAGEAGQLAARHIAKRRPARLLVANRSSEPARVLAVEVAGEPIGLHELHAAIASVDVVVAATRAPGFVISAEAVLRARTGGPERPLVLVDLSVPRNVEPAAGELPGVSVLSMDGIRARVDSDLERRTREAPRVEAIVDEELARFCAWQAGLGATPVLRELREHFDRVRREELERSRRHFSPGEQKQLERLTEALVNKLLHTPTERLRAIDAETPAGAERLEAVRELFALDGSGQKRRAAAVSADLSLGKDDVG